MPMPPLNPLQDDPT